MEITEVYIDPNRPEFKLPASLPKDMQVAWLTNKILDEVLGHYTTKMTKEQTLALYGLAMTAKQADYNALGDVYAPF